MSRSVLPQTVTAPLGRPPATRLELTDAEKGILLPVVYASIFQAPVRLDRLWSQIVGVEMSPMEMCRALEGPALRQMLSLSSDLVCLRGSDLEASFIQREASTRALLERHHDVLSFVAGLRTVRLAALSGGCAHDAADDGDIDVFVVTEPGALWRTLLRSTLVAKKRGWRKLLCLNYLVDTTALALPWRDFYGAFELISLRPFKGEAAFAELIAANPWVESMFPNFFRSRVTGQNPSTKTLDGPGGRLIETTARMIHRSYLRYRLPKTSGIELSDRVVRLHSTDHRTRLRGLFQDALQNIGMEAPSWI
ncbi:MAG: hypothetical protein ABI672_16025 [Vicinamibacteria bacterium]